MEGKGKKKKVWLCSSTEGKQLFLVTATTPIFFSASLGLFSIFLLLFFFLESSGADRHESVLESLVETRDAVEDRESDVRVVEQLGGLALGVLDADLVDADDLDVGAGGSVVGGHVGVELLDSAAAGDVTELLVDVVGAVDAVVSEEDAKVLDHVGELLGDLVDSEDLTVGAFDLFQLGEEVPEAGLGDDLVGGEDAHAVEGVGLALLDASLSANDLIFTDHLLLSMLLSF